MDAEGHLASDTAAGQSTSFIYDADGNRLLRKAPGATTLYLGSQELMLVSGATTARGSRYYSLGGQTIAVRTKAGLSWLFSDHQGTKQLSVAVTTGLEVTQRRQSPFGEARGVSPGAWPDEKGFVGGTVDASTGLTHLGAREYDASTGRFVSADPIMDVGNPQQVNGHTYSNSSPVTFSDPSGLFCDGCEYAGSGDHHGVGCSFDPTGGCRSQEEIERGHQQQVQQQKQVLAAAGISDSDYRKAQELEKQSWVDVALEAGGEVLKEILGINDMAKCFGEGDFGACASMVLGALPWGKILKADKIAEALHGAVKAVRSFLKQQEWARCLMARARDALSRGGCNSFTPETQVLMADGSRKPLARVQVGDKVRATDPETGESEAKTVSNVIIGYGRKNLVEITVDTDGKDGSATGTVTATDGHPFWLPDQNRWVRAGELKAGSMLQTSAEAWVQSPLFASGPHTNGSTTSSSLTFTPTTSGPAL